MKLYYDNTLDYDEINLNFLNDKKEPIEIDHSFFELSEEELYNGDLPLERLELADTWIYYCHDGSSTDYSKEAFEKVFEIDTVYELWEAFRIIKNVQFGMHFLVRKGVSPCWDDPVNSHLWWIKRKNLNAEEACNAWSDLAISAVGLSMFKDSSKQASTVNNVSVSYKDGDYVFKIMLNSKVDDPELYKTINMGKNFTFDFVKGGRLIENTGGKKTNENKPKKSYKNCKNFSPKKNYRQPLKAVN